MVNDLKTISIMETYIRLNPCCNGRWSMTGEYRWYISQRLSHVLILVVMEDGQWLFYEFVYDCEMDSLNPCCNGRWSMTFVRSCYWCIMWVLILVVMEDGQWHCRHPRHQRSAIVLILVVMEDGQWPNFKISYHTGYGVLILVVMEDGQWPSWDSS